jgi:hypothetical protein
VGLWLRITVGVLDELATERKWTAPCGDGTGGVSDEMDARPPSLALGEHVVGDLGEAGGAFAGGDVGGLDREAAEVVADVRAAGAAA